MKYYGTSGQSNPHNPFIHHLHVGCRCIHLRLCFQNLTATDWSHPVDTNLLLVHSLGLLRISLSVLRGNVFKWLQKVLTKIFAELLITVKTNLLLCRRQCLPFSTGQLGSFTNLQTFKVPRRLTVFIKKKVGILRPGDQAIISDGREFHAVTFPSKL